MEVLAYFRASPRTHPSLVPNWTLLVAELPWFLVNDQDPAHLAYEGPPHFSDEENKAERSDVTHPSNVGRRWS
jgi:hypothetical protein